MDDHPELVREASRGSPLAIDALLERHLPGAMAFVRLRAGARLRARESSLDIVQSACREILQDIDRVAVDDEEHFRHWLFLAVERKILDRARYWNRQKREAAREVAWPRGGTGTDREMDLALTGCGGIFTPSREAAAHEELERLQGAFAELADDHREVILLARVVGLPHAEIAERMDRSEGAVRVLLHRALARLATVLGEDR